MYNTLLTLSRNLFFYKNIGLQDSFETRIYLMFFHFSIMMIIFKKKHIKFSQSDYDIFFHNIENNLRELGFGDVSVNKKMKELNKILYDILLKLDTENKKDLKINENLVLKYFTPLKSKKKQEYKLFTIYLNKFYKFCFELPLNNMIRDAINFKY